MRTFYALALSLTVSCVATALLAQGVDAPRLRGPDPFTRETAAPALPRPVTDDIRRKRNYPDQPPVIPHAIEGYAMDLNANKCLSCHTRKLSEQSQAPMISVTHYQDRDGNFLGGVAARRYACLACHVPQSQVSPLVPNSFTDVDEMVEPERRGRSR